MCVHACVCVYGKLMLRPCWDLVMLFHISDVPYVDFKGDPFKFKRMLLTSEDLIATVYTVYALFGYFLLFSGFSCLL